jgi:hypothetical protein
MLCVVFGPFGSERDRSTHELARLRELLRGRRNHSEQKQSIGMGRIAREHFETRGVRALEIAAIEPLLRLAMPALDFCCRGCD